MSLEVLSKRADNAEARSEMRRRGLDFVTPWLAKALHKTRIVRGVNVGQLEKSWDVLKTLQFIEKHVDKNAPVVDFGAYGSEVLCGLHKMGFSDLVGIDLNPKLTCMPSMPGVRFVTGDFTKTTFSSASFGAVTAISVLEHGFCGAKIFSEIARILRPGGYFLGSTDYWPEKVDTSGVMVYGLDWRIFSKQELLNFFEEARQYGLVPVGQLNFEASEVTIRWFERGYTFAWFAFQKVQEPAGDSQRMETL